MTDLHCKNASKDEDGMANSLDPPQTANSKAVWLRSTLIAQTCLSEKTWDHYDKFQSFIGFLAVQVSTLQI